MLPSGAIISLSYLNIKSMKVRPFTFTNSRFSFNHIEDSLCRDKNLRAAMPNLIHSLDACSIALLYKEFVAQGESNIYTVHDCFASTAEAVDLFILLLKGVYIKIYSDVHYLVSLDTHIRNTIINTFGKDIISEDGRYITINDKCVKYPSLDKIVKTNPSALRGST